MEKKTVLVVGAGNVGTRVIKLLRRRVRILAQTSDRARRPALRALGATPVVCDLDQPRMLPRLRGHRIDAVIHLAPPPARGTRDTRTRRLLQAIVPKHPARFHCVYVSTTGVYGDCGGARFDESRPVHPQSARACRRVDAERVLMRTAKRRGWRSVVLRAPGIYDAEHLPAARLAAHTPALATEDDVYTNHIHADDLAALCVAALGSRRRWRVYHACDDSELRMGEYFDLVADALGLPRPPRLKRAEIMAAVPPVLWSFMRESRRPSNARVKRELGVRLRHPSVDAFLREFGRKAEARD